MVLPQPADAAAAPSSPAFLLAPGSSAVIASRVVLSAGSSSSSSEEGPAAAGSLVGVLVLRRGRRVEPREVLQLEGLGVLIEALARGRVQRCVCFYFTSSIHYVILFDCDVRLAQNTYIASLSYHIYALSPYLSG